MRIPSSLSASTKRCTTAHAAGRRSSVASRRLMKAVEALGAARSSVRGYASGGWAPGDEAEAELASYAAKGFTAAKMRVVGRDGFSIAKCVRRVKAARRGLGPKVEL